MMIHIRRCVAAGSLFFLGSLGLGSSRSQRQHTIRSSGLYTPQLGQSISPSPIVLDPLSVHRSVPFVVATSVAFWALKQPQRSLVAVYRL
jgi:hypothetical protein